MSEFRGRELVHPDCPNFMWYEVWKSETAKRNGLHNWTDHPKIIENARGLAKNILQPVRDQVGKGVKINSWCRLEPLEKAICWESFKRWCAARSVSHNGPRHWEEYFKRKTHPLGGAADIEVMGMSNLELWHLINDMELPYDQLILEYHNPAEGPNDGWVHVSWSLKPRGEMFELPRK